MLRPGGFFIWSATPVYQKLPEDVEIWNGKFFFITLKCLDVLERLMDSNN